MDLKVLHSGGDFTVTDTPIVMVLRDVFVW